MSIVWMECGFKCSMDSVHTALEPTLHAYTQEPYVSNLRWLSHVTSYQFRWHLPNCLSASALCPAMDPAPWRRVKVHVVDVSAWVCEGCEVVCGAEVCEGG